jgi:hypothetical protein
VADSLQYTIVEIAITNCILCHKDHNHRVKISYDLVLGAHSQMNLGKSREEEVVLFCKNAKKKFVANIEFEVPPNAKVRRMEEIEKK